MAFAVENLSNSNNESNTYNNDTSTTNSVGVVYISSHWLTAIYGFISVSAGLGNITVLITFMMKRKLLEKNFNLLILNLSVADLFVGVFDLPCLASACTCSLFYYKFKYYSCLQFKFICN